MAKYIRRGLNQNVNRAFENPLGYFDLRNGMLAACANGFALAGRYNSAQRASEIFKKRFPNYPSLGRELSYHRPEFLAFFATRLFVSRKLVAYVDRLHVRDVPARVIAERLQRGSFFPSP